METSKKVSTLWCGKVMIGGAEGNRTPDPLNAIEVLSLAELQPHTAVKYSKWYSQAQGKTQILPASRAQIDILNRPH